MGAQLDIIDDLPPEDVAMLQALQSRSAAPVRVHLDKVAAGGSSKFMKNYVAGYNHKSIADCGSTTVSQGIALHALVGDEAIGLKATSVRTYVGALSKRRIVVRKAGHIALAPILRDGP
jgi:hypothetical protein